MATWTTADERTEDAAVGVVTALASGRIGRFVILRELGAGAMGVVYAAYDEELHRRLAIKLLHAGVAGTEGRGRLLREAQAMARVSHPNVVQIYEVGVHDEEVFVAMELVDGQTLADWQRVGEHTAAEILHLYLQAGRGLAAAHAVGLIHRDFKPDNVLVDAERRVRVGDFGLARALLREPTTPNGALPVGTPSEPVNRALADTVRPAPASVEPGPSTSGMAASAAFEETAAPATASASGAAASSSGRRSADLLARPMTQFGAIVGTPAYMAPEQHCGDSLDARSDQFSFCAALYTALYDQRPFAGETVQTLVASLMAGALRPPPPAHPAPTWIFPLLQRGLAKNPEDRWPDLNILLAQLDRDPRRDPTSGGRERRRLGWLLIVATVAVPSVGFLVAMNAGDFTLQPADLVYPAGTAAVAVAVGVLIFGRTLLRDHFHRDVIAVAGVAALQMLVLRLILVAGEASMLLLLRVDFAATTMLCAVGALLVTRAFWWVTLVPALGTAISLALPQYAEPAVHLLYPALALVFLYVWNHAPGQPR